MKIATFNVSDVNKRLASLLTWLAEARPDIVCLQELKSDQNRFPKAELREAGYEAAWRGQRSSNGVAHCGGARHWLRRPRPSFGPAV